MAWRVSRPARMGRRRRSFGVPAATRVHNRRVFQIRQYELMTEQPLYGGDGRDPIYGFRGSGRGRGGEAIGRLFDCVRILRDTEIDDDVAVGMLLDAAGSHRAALHSFAEKFTGRDWRGDPLLMHVSELVAAAESGRSAAPLDGNVIETVRLERHLLSLSPDAAYAYLASRCPPLVGLEYGVQDPEWRDQRNAAPRPLDPPWPALDHQGVSASVPKPVRWLFRRQVRRIESDPRFQQAMTRLESVLRQANMNRGVIEALRREFVRLVGPRSQATDPLLRTYVAYIQAFPRLFNVAGLEGPSQSPAT
jgi:hypothetical protein